MKRLPCLLCLLASTPAAAGEIRVAVASNFAAPLRAIAERFEATADHRVTLIPGSTGKHYAQIRNGAPFDAFFAADAERPQHLEEEGLVVPGSRFTYAVGALILWSPRPNTVDPEGRILEHGDFRYLAIANPGLAPYGRAAREVLQARGLWETLQGRLVRGENIGQAHQFVRSGNAELGFMARSQVIHPGRPVAGSSWHVPHNLHSPVEQQAVLLNDNPAATAFLLFVRGDDALTIIHGYGYETP